MHPVALTNYRAWDKPRGEHVAFKTSSHLELNASLKCFSVKGLKTSLRRVLLAKKCTNNAIAIANWPPPQRSSGLRDVIVAIDSSPLIRSPLYRIEDYGPIFIRRSPFLVESWRTEISPGNLSDWRSASCTSCYIIFLLICLLFLTTYYLEIKQ